jgi:hypothetical protein
MLQCNIVGSRSMQGPWNTDYSPARVADLATAWTRFAFAYGQMWLAAGEVIARRSLQITQGAMSGPEAVGMVMEKATVFVAATEQAVVAAARGADPAAIASAALKPIRAKARANARRLRR